MKGDLQVHTQHRVRSEAGQGRSSEYLAGVRKDRIIVSASDWREILRISDGPVTGLLATITLFGEDGNKEKTFESLRPSNELGGKTRGRKPFDFRDFSERFIGKLLTSAVDFEEGNMSAFDWLVPTLSGLVAEYRAEAAKPVVRRYRLVGGRLKLVGELRHGVRLN